MNQHFNRRHSTLVSCSKLAPFAAICMAIVLALTAPKKLHSDEGMWLFSNLPLKLLKRDYGFDPNEKWADRLMKSCVRFNVGGSASFVSSKGLVLTNHHVGSDAIQKLSTPQNDYLANGFLAKSFKDELKAVDLELNQLISITDVTIRVNQAVEGISNSAKAADKRKEEVARIEKEFHDKTQCRCNVVTLYGGGRYHLYQYKQYTDVRLVWAPESDAAFFGGDADNFEYPRYCLDACLFRVYENGKPAKIKHFLKWNNAGLQKNELVFVAGNPGSTKRIYTTAALKHERDQRLPRVMDYIRRREILYQQYALNSPDAAFQVNDDLLGIQNARKHYMGLLAGLQNPSYFQRKAQEEQRLLSTIRNDAKLGGYAKAWQEVADVQERKTKLVKEFFSINATSYNLARAFVRLAIEDAKPNVQRFPEYRNSSRNSMKQRLLSEAPLFSDLERVKLAESFGRTVEIRGADNPLCQTLLHGKNPDARAEELIAGTQIMDPDFRRGLFQAFEEDDESKRKQGRKGILNSKDPMIQLAIQLDKEERRMRTLDEQLDEEERQAYGQIAEVQFALKGTSVYPDATFTLRLAFGQIAGYSDKGRAIPAFTTMAGAFQHEKIHESTAPWKLPESWHDAKNSIRGETPFNFVCTADIVGGNSGSPVVNQKLELVGLIFDGNIQSLTSEFIYCDQKARAISVNSAAISEALRTIYDAEFLADELGN